MSPLFTLFFTVPICFLLGMEVQKILGRRRRARALPPGAGPYREPSFPVLPERVETWTVLPIGTPPWKCRFCQMDGGAVTISAPCNGRRLFGALFGACPQHMSHHHVSCSTCMRSWFEGSATTPEGGTSS